MKLFIHTYKFNNTILLHDGYIGYVYELDSGNFTRSLMYDYRDSLSNWLSAGEKAGWTLTIIHIPGNLTKKSIEKYIPEFLL